MHKYIFRIIYFLLSLFLLSSCFEIKEKIHFNKDGSGTYAFIVDMGELKSLMDMMKNFEDDSSKNNNLLSNSEFKKLDKLKKIKGLKNVKTFENDDDFYFGFEFSFNNISALNQALNALDNLDNTNVNNKKSEIVYFKHKKRYIQRTASPLFLEKIKEDFTKKGNDMSTGEVFTKNIMGDISFTSEYTFDKEIKKVKNKVATISEDQKTIRLTTPLFTDNKKLTQKNKIIFKKK